MVQAPSGTVTFVFTDVVGSTQLWEQDRTAMADALQRHDDLVRAEIMETGGFVFSTAGDSFAVAYPDAAAAVDAALRIRQRLSEPGSVGLGVRIGLNTGTAVERGGNYFGPVLNRCARITALGGAGDIFLAAATAELLDGVELFDVGRHRLRGVEAPQRLFALRRADGDPPGIPDPGSASPVGAELIGRDADLSTLRRLLREHRLVTLVGTGGVGKTALARRLAHDLAGEFDDGTLWCELAPVRAGQLSRAVAAAIGLTVEAPQIADVVASLRHRQALVVLDNCEQLIGAAADLAAALSCCPRVTLLCTSREALRVGHEMTAPIALLERDAAVQLFAARAGRAAPDRVPTRSQAEAICDRLEGLPLALELAASRLTTMTATDLAERLSDGIGVLRTGARDVPGRHRTLRDSIEWSWEALNATEQRVLGACAVFADGFSLPLLQSLGRRAGYDPFDVEDALGILVERSLVVLRDGVDGRARYRLLESIRAFALEQLEAQKRELLTAAFVDAMVEASAGIGDLLCGPQETVGLGRFFEELANLRAAVRIALELDLTPERAYRVALAVLGCGTVAHSHSVEPVDWLTESFEQWGIVDHPLTASALLAVGVSKALGGDRERARELITEGHRRHQLPTSEPSNGGSTTAVALLEWVSSNYAGAVRIARVAVKEARNQSPNPARAIALGTLLNWMRGDEADFDAIRRESHDVAYAIGAPSLIAFHHTCAGIVATAERHREARAELQTALDLATEAELPIVNLVRRQLLLLDSLAGDYRAAAAHGALAIEGLLSAGEVYTAWVAVRFCTLALAGAGYWWEALVLDAACSASPTASRRLPMEHRAWQAIEQRAITSVGDPQAAIDAGRSLAEHECFQLALTALRALARPDQTGRSSDG